METAAIPDRPLMLAVIFFIAGVAMRLFPPKNINVFYGYRTPGSMSSRTRWDFAQRYASIRLLESGAILGFCAWCVGFISDNPNLSHSIGMILVMLVLASLFIRTEISIKKKYPNP